ncbi:MAG: Hsp20/alpha crystallin family protein [Salinivirgaceae bacterium]|nr:Hsp20/alpha crystallin family protein [Salinivirgaceae bacterium]
MTLVKFNYPGSTNGMARKAFFESFNDSHLGRFEDCKPTSELKYHVSENDTSIELKIALPGYSKEDILIELDNQILTIKSNKPENESENSLIFESFEKKFKLSDKINTEGIEAKSENGILTIVFAKVEAAVKKAARNIDIL